MPYSPRTGDFVVNGATAGSQTSPLVTRLNDGRVVVVWGGPTTAQNNQFGVRAQFFDGDGNKVGSELFLTDLTIRGQVPTAVAPLPDGGFAVSWVQGISSGSIVKVQFYNAAGVEVSAEHTVASIQAFDGSLAALPSGSVVFVWTNSDFNAAPGDGSGAGIGGTILAPNGTRQDFSVHTTTLGSQVDPQVTLLHNGNFVVTWTDYGGTGGDTSGAAVRGQIFTAAGVKVGTEFLVNTTAAGDQYEAEIVALPSGGFVVVWTDAATPGTPATAEIRGQVFDETGGRVGDQFTANTTTADQQSQPAVTVAEDGTFVISWSDRSGGTFDVRARQFAANGTTIGSEFILNSFTAGDQTASQLAAFTSGELFAVWSDLSGLDGSGSGVVARIFTNAMTVTGGAGPDNLTGGSGNDAIYAGDGADVVNGREGNDYIEGGAGADTLVGGAGNDQIVGGDGNDAVYGDDGNDLINGQSGNDYVEGGAGVDIIYGGAGNDQLVGGADNDAVYGEGDDDIVNGQGGNDYVDGGDGNDIVYGGAGADQIVGAAGNDALYGEADDDVVNGQDGDDYVDGGDGTDFVYGGAGNDTIVGGLGVDNLFGEADNDIINGQDGGDYISGGSGGDTLFGGDGNDLVEGDDGTDGLYGGAGDDTLAGGAGNDALFGDSGADILDGGAGDDQLTGGAGNDIFRFSSASHSSGAGDAIFDFVSGDRIDLSLIDANSGAAGDQAFTFIGSNAFSNTAGQLRVVMEGNAAHIFGDINGDGAADLHIVAYNLAAPLQVGDFTL